jgi:putative N6-adenine-specific DNA methylase
MHGRVHIEKRELAACEVLDPRGVVAMNPPYGERMGDVEALKPLYVEIGDTFKKKFKGWTGYVFTGSPDLAKVIGLKASRRFVLFNGAMECRLLKFDLY